MSKYKALRQAFRRKAESQRKSHQRIGDEIGVSKNTVARFLNDGTGFSDGTLQLISNWTYPNPQGKTWRDYEDEYQARNEVSSLFDQVMCNAWCYGIKPTVSTRYNP